MASPRRLRPLERLLLKAKLPVSMQLQLSPERITCLYRFALTEQPRLLSQIPDEHIRMSMESSRLLAILTSRVTVWGIDYVAESPVKELSYVPVLDVSLIPGSNRIHPRRTIQRMEKWIEPANHLMTRWRMGTERRSHKRMNGTPGPDRTRDSDNPGNRQKEMGRILESA
ncbi:hypothetical protein Tco_0801035 [Tanacetum coccineum]|uniref:Uncharacterized protein n=1 Tax=Tanacetum coccineum TaxID=301880 RepID=A0ABQ4ZVR3_9ASTR